MAPPSFDLAMLWESTDAADAAGKCIEDLFDLIPAGKATPSVVLRTGGATLHLRLDFSLYSRTTLAKLEAHAQKSGGKVVELMRVREEQRETFRVQFLRPIEGEPVVFESFALAARSVRDHLKRPRTTGPGPSPQAPGLPAVAPGAASTRPLPQRAPRYDVVLGVEFKTEAEFVREHVTNISKGGMFVRTRQRPALNSVARLTIHVPNGESLDTTARVVHVLEHPEHGGLGLAFIPGDAAFEAKLKQYLATLPGGAG